MPFHDLHDLPEFKEWLVKTLEPMCDADPVVMSDYIIALLKHDATMSEEEWKEFFTRELGDFLDTNSRPFVDQLFETLKTKSFLPSAPVPIPAAAAAVAAAQAAPALVSSYRPEPASAASAPPTAPTGPAANQPIAGPSRAQPRNGQPGGDVEMGGGGGGGEPKRQKCFDYHERGFCMRGVNCPYEHDADVIIPTPEMMFAQMNQMGPGPGPGGHMGMPFQRGGRGVGRGRGRGRGGPPNGANGHGQEGFPQLPQGFPQGQPGQPGHPGQPGQPGQGAPFMPFMPSFASFLANDPRRDFWGSNRPPQEKTLTLVVTDIPPKHLSVPSVRDYFSQFGEVTNVAIETSSKRALVSFDNNRDAYKAWKSDEAVFGSRHVKVLWHRPRPGQGDKGQKALEASAGLVANLKKIESGQGVEVQGGHQAKLYGPDSRLKDTLAELETRERRGKKETLIAEQKVLLNKAKTADREEKMKILNRLKEIGKAVEDLDKPIERTDEVGDVEMSDKDKLDAELAKHGMESVQGRDQEELLKLNAQLSALKEKATTLGIPASASRYSPYPGARGSRGRGRARGRGRGAATFQRPMRLDNRSRVVALSGEALGSAQGPVREWYESTGGHVEDKEGRWLVTYPTREMAERALAMGTKEIPGGAGAGISATWHVAQEEGSVEVDMAEESRRGDAEDEE